MVVVLEFHFPYDAKNTVIQHIKVHSSTHYSCFSLIDANESGELKEKVAQEPDNLIKLKLLKSSWSGNFNFSRKKTCAKYLGEKI